MDYFNKSISALFAIKAVITFLETITTEYSESGFPVSLNIYFIQTSLKAKQYLIINFVLL